MANDNLQSSLKIAFLKIALFCDFPLHEKKIEILALFLFDSKNLVSFGCDGFSLTFRALQYRY